MEYADVDRQYQHHTCATPVIGTCGRLHDERPSKDRTPFHQDSDRIVHTTAFRRLMHKTQVFFSPDSDHVRTRLTHTIEVARAARSLAQRLRLNPNLAESVALAHDLGHTPFGHAGEYVLSKLMADYGGFDHNSQTIRIVTSLSRTYLDFDGLNLTWDCLEGIAKHNGPVRKNISPLIVEYNLKHDLKLHRYPSAEAQAAALADDIAYNCHDLQDGLRIQIFSLKDIRHLPILGRRYWQVKKLYPGLDDHRMMHAVVRHLFGCLMDALVEASMQKIIQENHRSVEDIRNSSSMTIVFAPETTRNLDTLRRFLNDNMYRTKEMATHRQKIEHLICHLFDYYMQYPENLPDHWQSHVDLNSTHVKARAVADYISGMTDNYAISTYARIVGITGSLSMKTVPHQQG